MSTETEQDLQTERMVVNMGPSHPVTHGTVKFVVTLDGERIEHVDVSIGYLHRGFEKMCENSTWEQVFPYTDRLNYCSPLLNNVGYALAVEKLIGIEATPRAQWIRVIISEIARIIDHQTNIAAFSMELGGFSPFLYLMETREMLWDVLEDMTGARLTANYVRIGGLKNDVPDNFREQIRAALKKCGPLVSDCDKLLTKNRIFLDRVRDVGVMNAEDSIASGFTGPCIRAAGVAYDVRKAHPYLTYDQINFDIPVGEAGDNFDRYMVRMEEMRQSERIIEQALDRVPDGPINLNIPSMRWQSKDDIGSRIESLIFHFKTVTEGILVPAGEIYHATEAANGELGFYLVSDGSGRPHKCRVRSPSFALTSAMGRLVKGGFLSDIIPTFDMINMIGGECDR